MSNVTDLAHAIQLATHSPDPSTQNGAFLRDGPSTMLPLTAAVNEFPRGVKYLPARWERPLKYSIIEHAERNAIYAAARHGIQTAGTTLVCPWAACADCARGIIQAGIVELVTLRPLGGDTNQRWDDSINTAMTMLIEAGVLITLIDPNLLVAAPPLLRNGQLRTANGEPVVA